MNNELLTMVTYIERERGVEREIVLTAIEQAIQQAARKHPFVTNDLRVTIDRSNLSIHVYDTVVATDEDTGVGFMSLARAKNYKPDVTEGESIEIEMPAARLGRIVAGMSKQMILQKIREAERSNTFSEFRGRIGEIVSGTVTAIVRRDVYVMVGKTEMFLPQRERIPTEDLSVGDTVRAVIHSVRSDEERSRKGGESHGPAVTLSRASPEFVRMLFRLEVAEISDGVVEIMGVSRDPGYRSKISVRTFDEKVDPVGACVGLRGVRVRNIVRELNGEKVDIVRWSEDVNTYITQALAPAKLESIEVDARDPNVIHVTVAPDQFSLAVGKRGQNARLTSRLTGWHVDIRKSLALASFEDQKAEAIRELAETFSVSTAVATQMADAGFLSVEGILDSDEESFVAATGLDEVTAHGLYAAAQAVAAYMGLDTTDDAAPEEEMPEGTDE